jgi:hypothetical protein
MRYTCTQFNAGITDLFQFRSILISPPIPFQSDKFKSQFCQQRLLCKSLAGNNVYVLTITSPENDEEESEEKVILSIQSEQRATNKWFQEKTISVESFTHYMPQNGVTGN